MLHQSGRLNQFTVLWSSSEEQSSSDEDESSSDEDDVENDRGRSDQKKSDRDGEELVCAARLQIDSQMGESNAESTTTTTLPPVGSALPNNLILVEEGKEPPQFSASKAYLFNTQFSQVRFFGRCFLCGCPGHSQRYCALKYCAHCDSYGHSIVCCGRQNFQIQLQRKKSFQRFVSRVHPEHRQSKNTKRTTKPKQHKQQYKQQRKQQHTKKNK